MDANGERRGEGDGRKPYEPPQIVSEDIFETTALACGKKPMQGGNCAARAKAS
jgi:hypothetical protein